MNKLAPLLLVLALVGGAYFSLLNFSKKNILGVGEPKVSLNKYIYDLARLGKDGALKANGFIAPEIKNNNLSLNKVKKIDINLKKEAGSLTANALIGSTNNFLPTGIFQWIILSILITLVIFAFRYAHSSREKYLNSPLKHA